MEVHGFEEENIVILMDDGIHTSPTKENMIAAYEQIVADSEEGDAIFLHYSGKSRNVMQELYFIQELVHCHSARQECHTRIMLFNFVSWVY